MNGGGCRHSRYAGRRPFYSGLAHARQPTSSSMVSMTPPAIIECLFASSRPAPRIAIWTLQRQGSARDKGQPARIQSPRSIVPPCLHLHGCAAVGNGAVERAFAAVSLGFVWSDNGGGAGNEIARPVSSTQPLKSTRISSCARTGVIRDGPPTESHTRHTAITVSTAFVYRSTVIAPPLYRRTIQRGSLCDPWTEHQRTARGGPRRAAATPFKPLQRLMKARTG